MKRVFFLLLIGLTLSVNSQQKFTLSGSIFESNGKETLIGANIIIADLMTGTISNEYGFYSITLAKGTYEISVSNIGYSNLKQTITLDQNISMDFTLTEVIESLDEVIIESNVEALNIKSPQMSVNSLTASSIKQIPVVFGEADVIKAITLLPGVSSGGEGAAGFNVRGGAADQNLILLDEATIFNSSHLFGLFSVFNPDAIKSLKLYKGGVPAKYGGRVASVLDIYQKEGNKNEFKANGGIGLVASRLLLEGPLKKGVGSFLLGGRATYAHLFLPLFDVNNIAYFYDLNTKLSYKLNQKNSIYLSGYFGRDVFNVSNSFENTYGNTVVNFRWNHLFNDKLFSNLSLIYSDYYYGLNLNFVGFEWNSGIQNMNIKYDFKQYVNDRYKLEYGLHSTYYRFNPGIISPNRPDSGINREALTNKFAFENAIYFDINQQLSEHLSFSYGTRLSSFLRLGQKELNVYENNQAVGYNSDLQLYEEVDPIGSESSSHSKVIKSFLNLEPRLAISYKLNDDTSLKTSYNRMTQYLHLISNTSSPTPLDVWTPSGEYIQPQILDQVAVGYFKSYNTYDLEIESFYKTTKNRIDYIDGANLIANKAIEQVLLNGQSRAYGFELLFRKNKGRFKGWFAYTLSKSEQHEYGLHSTYYRFNPGIISPNRPDSGINREALTNKFAFENAIYFDINQQLSEHLSFSYGTRLSSFLRLGQKELNVYENNQAVGYNSDLQLYEEVDPIGSESSSHSKVIKSFLNLEPRLAISYKLNDDTSLKTSYNRMTQYLHLISNTSSPTPLDVWTPSGEYIQPQILDQVAVGYFKSYNTYDLEIESFYKTTKNRIDYIDGANLIANKAIEQVLLNGQSRAYGFELLFRKNKGRFKGWFAYTLSKSEQQTKGINPSDPGINNGNWYNTPYDKTHDISITSSYDLSDKWKLNANFIYQTGQPTTYPNGQYEYNNLIVSTFESRNSSRLDAYHRFDISGTYNPKKNKEKRWKGEWVFSIYNLYNRKNTQSLNFRENIDTGQNEALKLSLFGAIGAVSYNFKF